MPRSTVCEMCNDAPVHGLGRDKFQARYCGPCIEERRRQGLNRVEVVCQEPGCGQKFYPRAKDAAEWGNFCRAHKFDDMVARGARVVEVQDKNGRTYKKAVFDPPSRFERKDVV